MMVGPIMRFKPRNNSSVMQQKSPDQMLKEFTSQLSQEMCDIFKLNEVVLQKITYDGQAHSLKMILYPKISKLI